MPDKSYEIGFKVSGADKAAGEVKKIGSAVANVGGSAKGGTGLSQVFGDVVGKAGVAGDALTSLGAKVAGPAAALAALHGVLQLVGDGLEEFGQKEAAVAQLDAALANAGELSDDYRLKLQALAGQLEATTTIADERWIAVLRRLTQFGADSSNIEQYAEAVKNLAGLMGGDIEGAAQTFSRAMAGSFELFGRYGIHVDAASTKTAQLQQVLDQLKLRGAGQLEAQAATLEGSARRVANAWGQLKENLGNLFGPGVVSFNLFKESVLNTLAALLPGTIRQVGDLKNANAEAAGTARDAAREIGNEGEKLKKAADEAGRLRKALDELGDAQLAAQLARFDLAQERGSISPEDAQDARARTRLKFEAEKLARQADDERARVREAAGKTGQAGLERQRALKALPGNDAELEAARAQAVAAGASGDTSRIQEDRNAAEARVRELDFAPGGDPALQAEARSKARAQLDALDRLGKAQDAQAAGVRQATEAAQAEKKAQEELASAQREAALNLRIIETKRKTAETAAGTEIKRAENAEQKSEKEFRERARKAREEAIGEAREGALKPKSPDAARDKIPKGTTNDPIHVKADGGGKAGPVAAAPAGGFDPDDPNTVGGRQRRGRIDGRAPQSPRDQRRPILAGQSNEAPLRNEYPDAMPAAEKQEAASVKFGAAVETFDTAATKAGNNVDKLLGIIQQMDARAAAQDAKISALESKVRNQGSQARNSRSYE